MSFSLEMRNPFLDYRIVELGLALDPRDLLQRGLSKWVLREAMRDMLPSMIADRADKQGFKTDEADWMRRGELGSALEAVLRSESLAARPYVQPNVLLAMLGEHRAGGQHEFDLWRAFAVERWLRLFIDPEALSASGQVATRRESRRRGHAARRTTPRFGRPLTIRAASSRLRRTTLPTDRRPAPTRNARARNGGSGPEAPGRRRQAPRPRLSPMPRRLRQ